MLRDPTTARELIKVDARIDAAIERCRFDAARLGLDESRAEREGCPDGEEVAYNC